MATEPIAIDIDDDAALARALAEVERTCEPRQLRRNGQVIAVLHPPAPPRRSRRQRTEEEKERDFRAAAGGWKGIVDADALIKEIYERRDADVEASLERQRYLDQFWNLGPDDGLPRGQ